MDTGKEFDKNVLLDQEDVLRPKMVTVEIAGKKYEVPEGITVIKALWYSGQEVYRGIGCLGGYCGACATYYRTKDDPKVRTCLACSMAVFRLSWACCISLCACALAVASSDLASSRADAMASRNNDSALAMAAF